MSEQQLSLLSEENLPAHLLDVDPNLGVEEAEMRAYMTHYRIINPTANILSEGEETYDPNAKAGYWMDLAKNVEPQPHLELFIAKVVSGYTITRHEKGEASFYGGFVRENDPVMGGSVEGSNFAERITTFTPENCAGPALARKATLLCCIHPENGLPCGVMVTSYSNNNVSNFIGPLHMKGQPIFAQTTIFETKARKNAYGSTNYDAVLRAGDTVISPEQLERVKDLNEKLANPETFNQFAGRFNFEKASEASEVDAAVEEAMS